MRVLKEREVVADDGHTLQCPWCAWQTPPWITLRTGPRAGRRVNGWYRLRRHIQHQHGPDQLVDPHTVEGYEGVLTQVRGAIEGLQRGSGVTQEERESWDLRS
jgi:hypothetical protein